jgi:hypothetical protein
MSKDIKGNKKYVGDIGGTMIEDIVYFFKEQGALGVVRKQAKKDVGGPYKGPKCFIGARTCIKKDIGNHGDAK